MNEETKPEEKNNIAKKNKKVAEKMMRKIKSLRIENNVGEEMDKKHQEIMKQRLKSLGYID